MLENHENQETQNGTTWGPRLEGVNRWLVVGAVALLVIAGLALGYGYSAADCGQRHDRPTAKPAQHRYHQIE